MPGSWSKEQREVHGDKLRLINGTPSARAHQSKKAHERWSNENYRKNNTEGLKKRTEKQKRKLMFSRKYTSHGYVAVYLPQHPSASKRNTVYEHRWIAELKLQRFLRPDEDVHHVNWVKDDNRPDVDFKGSVEPEDLPTEQP